MRAILTEAGQDGYTQLARLEPHGQALPGAMQFSHQLFGHSNGLFSSIDGSNTLGRTVFFNRLGEVRDRSIESQRARASGLNLPVAAIIL